MDARRCTSHVARALGRLVRWGLEEVEAFVARDGCFAPRL